MKSKINIFFPNKVISGHELEFIKILNKLDRNNFILCIYINKTNQTLFEKSNNLIFFYSKIHFLKCIFFLIKKNRNILLVSGSPYAFPIYKLCFKMLFFDIVEYTPFSEKYIKSDRLYHKIIPFINRICIKHRILIDYWQLNGSSVKNNFVIRNLV